jgi:hypothetical protein
MADEKKPGSWDPNFNPYKSPDNRRPPVKLRSHHATGHHPNQMSAQLKPHTHHGSDGKRRYHHSHSNHILPTSLQRKLGEAHAAIEDIHYLQRTTSVPTNPSQCPNFPHPHQIKDDIQKARQAAIDDWHEENPHHRVEDHHG